MTRATFTIAVAFLCAAAAAEPLVTYESPCECRDNHGKHRWAEKNDPALPPTDPSAIQAVTPRKTGEPTVQMRILSLNAKVRREKEFRGYSSAGRASRSQ